LLKVGNLAILMTVMCLSELNVSFVYWICLCRLR